MHMKISPKVVAALRGEKSNAQLIFESLAKCEISQDAANKHIALLVADTLEDHWPRDYPNRSQALESYIQNRIRGMIRREHAMAIKNGEWLQLTARIRTKNISDYELLTWSGRICRDIGAKEQTDKIRAAVMKHISHHDEFCEQDYQSALDVQVLDSDEKRRGES